jgi:hypothetical protein
LAGAHQEVRRVETGVTLAQGRQAARGLGVLGFLVAAGFELGRGASRLDGGGVLGLAPHAPSEHGVELVEHYGGERGEEQQFKGLQGRTVCGRRSAPINGI